MNVSDADGVQSGDNDEDDQVTYDDGSDDFEDESDVDDYESVLFKPWSALDEEELDAALNLGVMRQC